VWLWPAENEAFDLLKDAAAQKILLIITFFSSFFSLIEMLLLAIKAISSAGCLLRFMDATSAFVVMWQEIEEERKDTSFVQMK